MKAISVFFLLASLVSCKLGSSKDDERKSHSDSKVLRCSTESISEFKNDLQKYDIWSKNSKFIDVKVPKEVEIPNCNILIEDLDDAIFQSSSLSMQNDEEYELLLIQLLDGSSFEKDRDNVFSVLDESSPDLFFRKFRPLKIIKLWILLLQNTFPNLVRIEQVGTTHEGRNLKALHISANNRTANPDRKTIIITGGVHAREWISVSSVCYIMYQLLMSYGNKPAETRYLNSLDFLIIPVFNPDGYEYTWNYDRLWRKNRQLTPATHCRGIDIDHSFGYHWEDQTSTPCNEGYSGVEPFEAMEAFSFNKYLNTAKKNYKVYGYIDFHSYSQEILYPYAYSCDETPRDFENLLELAYGMSKAIRTKTQRKYSVVAACQDKGADLLPGLGSGSALDFMYHQRAFWAFQIKLRDSGNYGFLLPENYILPTGQEAYAAVRYFCDFILNPEL